MNHFESVEQIRADIDMQGEYFNVFACKQLKKGIFRREAATSPFSSIPCVNKKYM